MRQISQGAGYRTSLVSRRELLLHLAGYLMYVRDGSGMHSSQRMAGCRYSDDPDHEAANHPLA